MKIPKGYVRYSGRRYRGVVRAGLDLPAVVLEEPENIGRLPGSESLLDCEGRKIHRLPLGPSPGSPRCFTYRFTNTSYGRSLRRSYAFRTLRTALLLKEKGFATIEVLAALKARGQLLNWTSLLVALEIDCVFELPSAGRHVFQIHPFVELSRDLARELGEYLAEFHRVGFFHGDLKTRHILVGRLPGKARFYLVDLEKCLYLPQLPSPVRAVLAARDLVQLLASLPARYETSRKADVLTSYLAKSSLGGFSKSVFNTVVTLYGEHGRFRQGKTVIGNLAALLKRKKD